MKSYVTRPFEFLFHLTPENLQKKEIRGRMWIDREGRPFCYVFLIAVPRKDMNVPATYTILDLGPRIKKVQKTYDL